MARLRKEMQEKITDLPEDVKKAISDYVEATLLAADHDCLHLYTQGANQYHLDAFGEDQYVC